MITRRSLLIQTAVSGLAAAAAAQVPRGAASEAAAGSRATMRTYKVPRTDLVVSRLAYGTSMLGMNQSSADFVARTAQAIRTAWDNGISFFDLADVYGDGRSELALGEVLKASPELRQQIVIQSKCGLILGEHVGGLGVNLSRGHIVQSVEASLRRLGTDHLDILLLHGADTLVQPGEVGQAFEQLHGSGKVRYFGVSNHSILQIELLQRQLPHPLVANQIRLGLGHSGSLREPGYTGVGGIVDYCQLHDVQVQAFSPLRAGASILKPPSLLNPSADAPPELKKAAEVLAKLAKEKATNPSAIALAWLLRHPAGIVPIIGATNPQHIIENCEADRVSLSREEWYLLFNAAADIQS